MDVIQQVNEKPCKPEIDSEVDAPLNTFKIEIKEEPETEKVNDSFDYLDLKEYPIKTEIKEDEDLHTPFEEKSIIERELINDFVLLVLRRLMDPRSKSFEPRNGHSSYKMTKTVIHIIRPDAGYACYQNKQKLRQRNSNKET
ncbi:unnamed protein product [Diabrotica balteata]|uniref:Uncharacterized protein n=1 Tax=Diabrotica balteata TaxID=107213 RepID=A0A9N9X5H6_DIABA|nr:unnamed protein product [Diabrotica balteata]